MMLRKFVCLGVVALAVTSAKMADAVVIGNFENGSLDGWASSFGGTATQLFPDNSPGYGAAFATNGTWALDVLSYSAGAPNNGNPAGGFRWSISLDANDVPNLGQVFAANPILAADVSWRTDEWSGDADGVWARWDTASINNAVSNWKQTSDPQMSDSANPGAPGSWDKNGYGATHTRTVKWNFSQVAGVDLGAIAAGATWFEINISTNYDALYNTSGGSFWIDNIRLEPLPQIPEPSTLAMAAVVGLLPLVRRRSHR